MTLVNVPLRGLSDVSQSSLPPLPCSLCLLYCMCMLQMFFVRIVWVCHHAEPGVSQAFKPKCNPLNFSFRYPVPSWRPGGCPGDARMHQASSDGFASECRACLVPGRHRHARSDATRSRGARPAGGPKPLCPTSFANADATQLGAGRNGNAFARRVTPKSGPVAWPAQPPPPPPRENVVLSRLPCLRRTGRWAQGPRAVSLIAAARVSGSARLRVNPFRRTRPRAPQPASLSCCLSSPAAGESNTNKWGLGQVRDDESPNNVCCNVVNLAVWPCLNGIPHPREATGHKPETVPPPPL